ncbi:MAG: hypothetical protein ACRC5T_02645 [Cetobacterium sp.]
MIKDQSKLVYPFVETGAMHWTIDKLLSSVGETDNQEEFVSNK